MSANSIAEKFEVIADAVYEKGRDDEHKDVFDAILAYGDGKRPYGYAFAYWVIKPGQWKPTKDIVVDGSGSFMFNYFKSIDHSDIDIEALCAATGHKIDFSGMTAATRLISYSDISNLGTVDVRKESNSTSFSNLLQYASKLKRLRLIIKNDGTQNINNYGWSTCTALEDFQIESGVIGFNTNWSKCPLNRASIENIVEHLLTTATGQTVTFNELAVNSAFTTDEWNTLVASRGNWSFSLSE